MERRRTWKIGEQERWELWLKYASNGLSGQGSRLNKLSLDRFSI